jgi:hypothetical protein
MWVSDDDDDIYIFIAPLQVRRTYAGAVVNSIYICVKRYNFNICRLKKLLFSRTKLFATPYAARLATELRMEQRLIILWDSTVGLAVRAV